MKATPEAPLHPAQNRLGEWTANLIRVGRVQLVIAVSEPTRMAVAIDAAPYASVPSRLCKALLVALLDLGIEPADALAEIESMLPLQIAVTGSRSVLSAVNQFAWMAECGVYSRGARSAAALTRYLADMIVLKPEHIGPPFPDRVREAFGLPPRERRRWAAADSALH
jgi:hypothetical protein